MSWQATHWIAADGPDDDKTYRLLMTIADYADEHGDNARVPERTLMERVKVGNRGIVTLVNKAISDGWLIITKPGDSRRPTTYALGVMPAVRGRCARVAPTDRGHRMHAAPVGNAGRTLDVSNVGACVPTPTGSVAHLPDKTNVPPGGYARGSFNGCSGDNCRRCDGMWAETESGAVERCARPR